MVIWKYRITDVKHQIHLPEGAKVLHVGEQYGDVCIWVLLNPKNRKEWRTFRIVGTGHPLPEDFNGVHHGTVQIGDLVMHVFELQTEKV